MDIPLDIQVILNKLEESDAHTLTNYIDNLQMELNSKEQDITYLKNEVFNLNEELSCEQNKCYDCKLVTTCNDIVNEQYKYVHTNYNDINTIKQVLDYNLRYNIQV